VPHLPAVVDNLHELTSQIWRPLTDRGNDTWVVSYPKSGVTWFRYMVALAVSELLERPDVATVEVSALLQDAGLPPVRWSHNGGALIFENGSRTPERALFSLPWVLGFQAKRVLLLVRDPRDVAVSYFHQVSRRSDRPLDVGTIDEFYADPLRGVRRSAFYLRRWERSKRLTKDLHVLRYESLLSGDAAALSDALSFVLQRAIDVSVGRSILERSNSASMREKERLGEIEGMRSFGDGANDLKVRRAVVRGYRDELSPASIELGDGILRRMGYPFGYCP
jgi:hypothetical protein